VKSCVGQISNFHKRRIREGREKRPQFLGFSPSTKNEWSYFATLSFFRASGDTTNLDAGGITGTYYGVTYLLFIADSRNWSWSFAPRGIIIIIISLTLHSILLLLLEIVMNVL
jgi:hypothetical protein